MTVLEVEGVNVSVFHQLTSAWALLADAGWSDWSEFSNIPLSLGPLSGMQERGWRDFFQVAQNLRVSLGVTDLQQSLDAADATVTGTFEYRDSQSRREQRQPVSFHASLERSATGWRITGIR